jgi:hypothetical protein
LTWPSPTGIIVGMRLEVVVPLTRSLVVVPMLRSFARQTVLPDEITFVTNWPTDKMRAMVEKAFSREKVKLNVRQLSFETDAYPVGMSDAGLRRNIAAWATDAEAMLLWDDDQIAAQDTVEASLNWLKQEDWVFGHHRIVEFADVPLDELVYWPASRGRPREKPPNHWHTYLSAYGGNVAVLRKAYIAIGGYDLIYTRGYDDINIGRRVVGDNPITVREPPFAWHPETKMPLDMTLPGNICPHHRTVTARDSMKGMTIVAGANPPQNSGSRSWTYAKCTKCPWIEPNPSDPEGVVHHQGPVFQYDPTKVTVTYTDLTAGNRSFEVAPPPEPTEGSETVEPGPVVEEVATEDVLPCTIDEPEPEAAPIAVNRPVTWADLSDDTWPDGAAPPRRGLVFSIRGLAYKILERDAEGVWWVADVSHGDESKRFVLVASEWLQNQADGKVSVVAPGDSTDDSWRTPVVSAPAEG